MKKNLLAVVTLIGFSTIVQAQKGRVGINTVNPNATLDIVANNTDATIPDALLVPRLSRLQLEAKNSAYADGTVASPSAQNGALVFVTSLGGLGTGKTVNVTSPGFYYYDGTTNVWKTLGSGTTAAATPFRLLTGQEASQGYDWTSTDYDYWEFNTGTLLNLGAPALFTGRTIHIRNSSGGTIQFTGTELITRPRNFVAITAQSAITVYSDGSIWYLISGRN